MHRDEEEAIGVAKEPKQARGSWWLVALMGLSSVVFGVLLIFWPGRTLYVTALVVGVHLLVFGVMRLGRGIFDSGQSHRGLVTLSGLVSIFAGLLVTFRPGRTLNILIIILGFYWVFSGFSDLVSGAMDRDHPERGLVMFLGLLSAVAGILLLLWSGPTLLALVVVAIINLIVTGITQIVLGFRLLRHRTTTKAESPDA